MKKLLSVVLTAVLMALMLFAYSMPSYAASGQKIRVRLSSMGYISSLTIKPLGDFTMPNGKTMAKNTEYTVTVNGSSLCLSTGGSTAYSTTDTYFKLTKIDTSKSGMYIKNTNPTYGNLTYLGDFTFLRSGSTFCVINSLDFETYLYGVVPFEIGENAGAAALRTQAIAARTYAIQKISTDQTATKYDILDTTANQVYRGYSTYTPKAEQAVNDTAGKVLMYNGGYASTNYTASNGGQAQRASDMFGGSTFPYLTVHDDEYDLRSTRAARSNVYFPSTITKATASATLDSKTYDALRMDLLLALYKAGYSNEDNDFSITGFKSVELFNNRYADPSRIYNYAKITANITAYKRDAAKDGSNVEYGRTSSTEKINIYQGPDVGYSVVGTLSKNSRVQILERNSGWVKICNVAGLVGYCTSAKVVSCEALASSTVKADGAAQENIELVFNTAIEDIKTSFVAGGQSLNHHTIWAVETNSSGVSINFRGNGHAVGMSQEGAIVMSAAGKTYEEILSFYYPGTTIATASYYLNASPDPSPTPIPGALYGTVKLNDVNSSLNVRASAGTTYSVVATVPHGARLQILENNGTWLKVCLANGLTGFVMASYIVIDAAPVPTLAPAATAAPTPQPTAVPVQPTAVPTPVPTNAPTTPANAEYGKVTTSGTSLNVRAGAGSSYKVVASAAKGSTVTIITKNVKSGWHYISLSNGTKGFVSSSYITLTVSGSPSTPNSTPNSSSQAGTVKITFSSLMIRSGPGTKYTSIGSLSNGAQVTILDKSSAWYKITTSAGKTGYCYGTYITTGSSSTNVTYTATKTVNGTVNVRKGAGTSYSVQGVLYKGAKVYVLGTSGSWTKISYGSSTAYVYSSYLS